MTKKIIPFPVPPPEPAHHADAPDRPRRPRFQVYWDDLYFLLIFLLMLYMFLLHPRS